ncbi:DUF1800 domain-containing protein [Rhizobium alvei]|uniref:DUF1800 family protein n=1 Tax=Rhizobium alvei TaxID=1132659 RepID=A0ABT8YHS7_9HYPH|nr:DUF1800 family protein [Rhizobium alvei]MDO6963222.1 DUF1800 family protein [Rhizobium alvei]
MSLSIPTMSAIRFGYGIRPGEPVPNGAKDLMAQLSAGAAQELPFPAEGIDGRYQTIAEIQERIFGEKGESKDARRERLKPIRSEIFTISGNDLHLRLSHTVTSPFGFYERLVAFWMDHFSVSTRKDRMMYLLTPLYEVEAIRPNVSQTFAELLRQAILHPAMLIYLDQIKSSGPNSQRAKRTGRGLNENLGRELLELHTLGVDGGYNQDDVRNAALVLTGLAMDRMTGRLEYRRQMAEPATIELFGKSYGGKRRSIEDVYALLDDLAAIPKTREHICRKLAVHFISDTPDPKLVEAMITAWSDSDGSLEQVYQAMLAHPAAWADPGVKARQPLDFVIAGLRAVNVPASALMQPKRRHNAAAQEEAEEADMAPPAPAMNPNAPSMARDPDEEEAQAEQTADRMEAMDKNKKPKMRLRPPVNQLSIGALRKLGQPLWEPASPAGTDEAFAVWISSSQLTNRIAWAQRVANRFGSQADPASLLKTVLRDAARQDTITIVSQAPNRPAGVAFVLASPEFNRR